MKWTASAIRRARADRGWTQRQLADQLGASIRSVASWERGEAAPQPHWDVKLDRLLHDESTPELTPQMITEALARAHDTELLGEFLRRLNHARRHGHHTGHDPTDLDSHTDVTEGPPLPGHNDEDDDEDKRSLG